MDLPYQGLSINQWQARTFELLDQHPLDSNTLYKVVLKVWDDLFHSRIGRKPYKFGVDLFPQPQIMGFFLHELIPLELEQLFPEFWRRDQTASEKDIVYIPDDKYSIEIKTSSSGRNIYGNRSYAQRGNTVKKSKSGYYLAVNFENFH